MEAMQSRHRAGKNKTRQLRGQDHKKMGFFHFLCSLLDLNRAYFLQLFIMALTICTFPAASVPFCLFLITAAFVGAGPSNLGDIEPGPGGFFAWEGFPGYPGDDLGGGAGVEDEDEGAADLAGGLPGDYFGTETNKRARGSRELAQNLSNFSSISLQDDDHMEKDQGTGGGGVAGTGDGDGRRGNGNGNGTSSSSPEGRHGGEGVAPGVGGGKKAAGRSNSGRSLAKRPPSKQHKGGH